MNRRIFALCAALPAAFVMGVWSEANRPPHDPDQVTLSDRQQAALEMIRLGMADWIAGCAYEEGRGGVSRPVMFSACTVRFGLGEPEHPERRPDVPKLLKEAR